MRKLLLLIFGLFLVILVFGQKNKPSVRLDSIQPPRIPAYNIANDADKGSRSLTVVLRLSGTIKANIQYKLQLVADNLASAPVLLNPSVTLTPADFVKQKARKEIIVKLKGLDCLRGDEHFSIKPADSKDSNEVITVTIDSIPVPANPVVMLKDGSSTIMPYLRSDNTNDGKRTVMVSLVLSGRRSNATNTVLNFNAASFVRSASRPVQSPLVNMLIPQSAFSENGCPVTIQLPLSINLAQIEKLESDETIPFLLTGDSIHAHRLIIQGAKPKTAAADSSKKPSPDTTGYSFNYNCIGIKFLITVKKDSIVVREEGDDKIFFYRYSGFFHTADFARWILNVFGDRIGKKPCNDCLACAGYMADRVQEELSWHAKNEPVSPVNSAPAIKDTTAKKEEKKTEADDAEPVAKDTVVFNDHISYSDSMVFALQVQHLKTKTMITLSADPLKDSTVSDTQSIAPESKEAFVGTVKRMIQKLSKEEVIDETKITPNLSNEFTKYQKFVQDQQPKKKTKAEKEAMAALTDLANEPETKTIVGIINCADSTVNIFNTDDVIIKTTKIDSIHYSIENGKLSKGEIVVNTAEGEFINRRSPISILMLNTIRMYDHLWNADFTSYILVGDVLKYDSKNGYPPDDVNDQLLTPALGKVALHAGSNLNSLVNFSFYTDLTGLVGRRPNGLLLTDVTGKFITNTGNFANMDITPFAWLEANVTLTKFDSKFKSIDSSALRLHKPGEKDTVDRLLLNQTAWLKGSIKVNLASIRFFSRQYLNINLGTKINVVNADSLFRKDRDIIFFDYFPEVQYSIHRLNNFGADLSLRWLFQRVADKEPFQNTGFQCIFNPQVALFYYPTSNQNKKVYLRFNYYAGHNKEDNNFYQLQFGWKTGLKLSK